MLVLVVLCIPGSAAVVIDDVLVSLSSLDLTKMKQGWGRPQIDQSITSKPLTIGGQVFEHGVGSHADSVFSIQLDGQAGRFTATVGVDDGAGARGSLVFQVYLDGSLSFDSGVMHGGDPAKRIDLDLSGVTHMMLLVTSAGDGIDYDHANWAAANFHISAGSNLPVALDYPPRESPMIITPKPGPVPAINGPRLFGVRPGHPFVYRIPCTGTRPIVFAVDGLPDGLVLDPATGVLNGTAPATAGEYDLTLGATNEHGAAERSFTLVVGETLALTPPMGWNSWYIHYDRVTEQDIREAANAMIDSGMADFGYMYVNVDDCWMKQQGDEPYRDTATGAVLCNAKFPDIAGMVDSIHALGLRAGIYTSPGPWTCAGYVGAYEHEAADARQFAEWGFDFLKYDWCSYENVATGDGTARLQRPYRQISEILRTLDRDVVLNLCQYGRGAVWEWGAEVGGQSWRTTGDLGLQQGALLPAFYSIGLRNARHHECAGPGRWNDPDYLMLGWVGSAQNMGEGTPTDLTPNEQYSYMSLWSLMAAPLFLSGDMTKLDAFTLNVLCNAEVIAINQDALGKQGRVMIEDDDHFIMVKEMEDGSVAVGLFNTSEGEQPLTVRWGDIGLSGSCTVRDVWRQEDLGTYADSFSTPKPIRRHGVMLIRVS